MNSVNTKIRDIMTFVHIGEYDDQKIISKLHDMNVYITSYLNHSIVSQRGIEIYSNRYTYDTLLKDVLQQSHYPNVTYSRFRTLGQGMYGKIAYFSDDLTINDVIKFLEAFHLRLVLTKYK